MQVATHNQIVQAFLRIPFEHRVQHNWGLAPYEHRHEWRIGDTYINGIALTVDRDYEMGYLLEVVDQTSSQVSYVVVVRGPGWHDSIMMDRPVGTFFERTIDSEEACTWAVRMIFGLLEAHNEVEQKTLDK